MAEKKKRIYVSGPISAETPEGMEKNLGMLAKVAARLRKRKPDAVVYNPGGNRQEGWSWRDYMTHDLQTVRHADGVHMTRGWRRSRGARIERRYAQLLGKEVTYDHPRDKGQLKGSRRKRGR